MMYKFGTNLSCGLGDTLLLNAVCKNLDYKATMQLRPAQKRFAILFDKIADIEITEAVNVLPEIGYGHYTLTKLRNFFNQPENLDIRPVVLHSDEESEAWATNVLSKIKKPAVIFQPNCSASWQHIRGIPPLLQQRILTEISDRYSIINMSSDEFKGLDLSKYICLLRKCGRYIGCNTGDMHLAISVGCICDVYEPDVCLEFEPEKWHYNHPAIKYKKF